jgi:hypothetical protein
MTDPREAKLPIWAQDELKRLRRELADVQAYRDQLLGLARKKDGEGFWLRAYSSADGDLPAPLAGKSLEFRGSTGRLSIMRRRDHEKSEDWLEISSGLDGDGLIIRPRASNVAQLRVARDGETE